MAKKNPYSPGEEDINLARRINRSMENAELPVSSDPLILFLEEYKSRATLKAQRTAGSATWKKIAAGMKGKQAKNPGNVFMINSAWWRTAAVILVTVLAGLYLFIQKPASPRLVAHSTAEIHEVLLPDQSTVTLRPNSRLYRLEKNDSRHVYNIKGEAYFTVSKQEQRMFVVYAGDAVVEVTGTAFTVSSWGNRTRVFLEEGSVRFLNAEGSESVNLAPGEYSEFFEGSLQPPGTPGEQIFTAWLRNEMVLNRRTAGDVSEEISHHFNIDVTIPEPYNSEKLSGSLRLDEKNKLLDDLGVTLGGYFRQTGAGRYLFVPNDED